MLYKEKQLEKLRNIIDARLASYEKDYLKWTTKARYMSDKIFDNLLVVVRKSKVTLTLNKPALSRMCILELRYNIIR